ncbi:MAG: hypothetical protein GXO55_07440 [Chloroflexi bacterium]|nr:hypothetical protein [Chloroflexota bacterium]
MDVPSWPMLFVQFFRRTILGEPIYTETPPAPPRSIFIRHVDGGSSYAADLELVTLTTPQYDLGQYGIRFVASPRHADILLLTGPLTWNMLHPTMAAFRAMPPRRRVVTVGDCADYREGLTPERCAFALSYAVVQHLPEDLRQAIVAHIPGHPPTPQAILETLLDIRT